MNYLLERKAFPIIPLSVPSVGIIIKDVVNQKNIIVSTWHLAGTDNSNTIVNILTGGDNQLSLFEL